MFFIKQLLVYLILNAIVSNLLIAGTPPKYRHGELKAFLNLEYFSTNENFANTGGEFAKLGSQSEFSYYKITPQVQYGLNRKWAIVADFDFMSGESVNPANTRSTNQLTDVTASLLYKIIKNKFYILPRMKVSIPIATFDPAQDGVILNDGALFVEIAAWIERKMLAHRFYLYSGYKYVADGRAHTIPYEVGVYNSYKGFVYGFAFYGNEIAQNDEFLDTPEVRNNRTAQLNAGSKKFYSVNPKSMNISGWVGYRLSRNLIAHIKAETPIDGSNTAKGNTYSLNFKWRAINPYKKISSDEKNFRIEDTPNNSN